MNTYRDLVNLVLEFINLLIPALFAIVMLFFVWKLVDSWVIHAGDPGAREDGKQYAIAAILMFVLMLSAWGIVTLLRQSLFGSPV